MRISDWSSDVCSSDLCASLRYVREGWHRPITNKERQEYRAEANAALIRAGQFEVRAEQGATAFAALGAVENAFARQDASWDRLGVSASSTFPMGLRFVQNPIYAGPLAAFQRGIGTACGG